MPKGVGLRFGDNKVLGYHVLNYVIKHPCVLK